MTVENERVIRLPDRGAAAGAIAAVEAGGGRVLHRYGHRILVVALPASAEQRIRTLLPAKAQLVAGDELERIEELDEAEVRGLRALRLRQSKAFRAAKAKRPHAGEPWDAPGLLEPDLPSEEPRGGNPGKAGAAALEDAGPASAAAVTGFVNERLINEVAVGIVIVDGVDDPYTLSDDDQDNIVAEVQEGLAWLGTLEPAADVSWTYDVKVTTLDIEPWKGARWPGMPASFYKGIDAAVIREDNGKLYFFKGDQYVRFTSVAGGVDSGYPKPIAGNWPGLPESFTQGIDAAVVRGDNGKLYFFKGDQYVRFTNVADGVDAGYPKSIADGFPGLPGNFNKGVDAALWRKDVNKLYFFRGELYVRFSDVSAGMDDGYPVKTGENWKGMPGSFNEGIDAALWRNSDSKIYFFKNGRQYGQFVRFTTVSEGVDDGYPQPIGLNTEEAESLWRDPALSRLGFAAGDEGVEQYIAKLRADFGARWGYIAFFTRHPVTWFAYQGGNKVVMQYGSENFDTVFAHETCHVFGAPDEYGSSNCNCGTPHGRFFKEPNDNCANCDPDRDDDCIMRNNALTMCPYTPMHLGWGPFMTKIDAALWRLDNNRLYLFSGDRYIRFTSVSDGRDAGYPARIAGNWPGLPSAFNAGIDAAVVREDNERLYFFKGSQYVRFTNVSDGIDSGYPKPIAGNWPGLPDSFNRGIDAALWRRDNDKLYFFKGSQYVRFTNVNDGVDDGYPKPIAGNWPGLPDSFNRGIDAAVWRQDNNKLYFFKGPRYVRFTQVNDGVDDGYPKWIDGNWIPFPTPTGPVVLP